MQCLSEDAVLDLIEGRLSPEALADVHRHLDECDDCRSLVAESTSSRALPEGARSGGFRTLAPGTAVGRFVILEQIGAGAMGIVYAAHDPELGRNVALKLLRSGPDAKDLRGRLQREAQVMAQLSHPNVIVVHDVGTFDEQIFLAMEFVEGETLGQWVRERDRSVPEVLAMFAQAGRGLSAAHAAGIVHRDFKPDNVLCGRDGRVRVTDFGLARTSGSVLASGEEKGQSPEAFLATLTRSGGLIGTPAYMAPEQMDGAPADQRSDIFGFSVALYEALYGERPFASRDLTSLRAAVREGAVREAPPGRRVPRRVRAVLLRGLAPDPAARWQSMDALLEALARGPLVTPARAGALLLCFGAVAFLVFARRPVCQGAETAWGTLWDGAGQERVHEAFAKTGRPTAEASFAQVAQALARFRAAWLEMHRDACEATRVRGDQSEALFDLRMQCLSAKRERAAALVRVFAAADGALVDKAPSALDALPSLDGCANLAALTAPVPLPEDSQKRARIELLQRTLADAAALGFGAREHQRALALLLPALEEARKVGYQPLLAQMLYVRGRTEVNLNQLQPALQTLHEAAATAVEAHDDGTLADAWSLVIWAEGYRLMQPQQGELYARYARSAIERLGHDDEREGIRLGYLSAVLAEIEHRIDEALPLAQQSRALLAKTRGPDSWRVSTADQGLAGMARELGRGEEALALHRKVEEARRKLFGPEADQVAAAMNDEAVDLILLGRAAEALPIAQRALELEARATAGHEAGFTRRTLARAQFGLGDYQAALASAQQAGKAMTAYAPPGYHGLCGPLKTEAATLLALHRPAEAVSKAERALDLCGQERDGYDPAQMQLLFAQALWDSGGDRARAHTLGVAARDALRASADLHQSWFTGYAQEAAAWVERH